MKNLILLSILLTSTPSVSKSLKECVANRLPGLPEADKEHFCIQELIKPKSYPKYTTICEEEFYKLPFERNLHRLLLGENVSDFIEGPSEFDTGCFEAIRRMGELDDYIDCVKLRAELNYYFPFIKYEDVHKSCMDVVPVFMDLS